MKTIYLLLIIILIIAALAFGAVYFIRQNDTDTTDSTESDQEASEANYTDVDAKEAYKLISEDDPEITIIDVSPRFNEGHLQGAVNYYVGDGSLDNAIPDLNKNKTYLVYCHVDSAAISGAEKLIEAGFSKVYRLKGNYSTWYEGGYPIEIEIKAVSGYSGSGFAIRSFLDGEFFHRLEADLDDPAAGKFYEGWLVKGSDFFSTGKMKKVSGQYVLEYTSNEDQRDYTEVVITEETESQGLDNNPETHVLEGEFK
ncbi:rhodanese-like domain-containing protein [Patescibacteria group bacterium]